MPFVFRLENPQCNQPGRNWLVSGMSTAFMFLDDSESTSSTFVRDRQGEKQKIFAFSAENTRRNINIRKWYLTPISQTTTLDTTRTE